MNQILSEDLIRGELSSDALITEVLHIEEEDMGPFIGSGDTI